MEPAHRSLKNQYKSAYWSPSKVVCVDAMATVNDAAKLMRENHVGDVVVIDRQNGIAKPVGMLTDRDITIETCAQDVPIDKILVGDIMSKPIDAASEADDIFQLIAKMKAHGISRLPIVNSSGDLVSIINANHLLNILIRAITDLTNLPDIRQQHERETRH